MPTKIKLPDGRLISVPDDARPEEIDAIANESAGPSDSGPQGSALGRFAGGVGEMLNPITAAQGIYQAVRHPYDTVTGIASQTGEHLTKARNAGSLNEFANEATAAIPVVGPILEGMSQQAKSGDIAGAAGKGVGLVMGPKVIGGALKGAGSVGRAVSRGMPNPNAAVRAAVAENLAAGVPVDAGTATGSRVVRGVQDLSDRSLGGFVAGSTRAAQRAEEGLAQRGTQLSDRVGPATTPEQAGLAVEQTIEAKGADLQRQANRGYDTLRAIEKQNPVAVDMRPVKQALQPIYDRMIRQMPVTQQQASPGLKALSNIIHGKDLSPLSMADADLGAIKSLARGADAPWLRSIGQGMAAKAVGELSTAVDQAVQTMGPSAERALEFGRAATRAKYVTGDVLEGLRRGTNGEAVKMFGRMVARGDAGIEQLREVQKIAPHQMAKVGRAFLDDLMADATAEGGFKRAAGLFKRWDDLGAETKKILFSDPALRGELDRFFLVAKKMSESSNPSGSALVGTVAAQGTGLLVAPMATLGSIATGATLSKLMHNPTAVRLMTEGMQLPAASPRLRTITANLQRLAKSGPVLGQAQENRAQ